MKHEERLFDALGNVSEEYVAEAAVLPKPKTSRRWIYIAAGIAAAGAVCFGAAAVSGRLARQNDSLTEPGVSADTSGNEKANKDYLHKFEIPEAADGLPKLSAKPEFGAMGFEGYGTDKIENVLSTALWPDDRELTDLPVFMGTDIDVPILNADDMEQRLSTIAGRIGEEFVKTEYVDGTDLDPEYIEIVKEKLEAVGDEFHIEDFYTSSELHGTAGDIGLSINDCGSLTIKIPLSDIDEAYRPTGELYTMTYQDAMRLTEHVSDKYYDLLGMYAPVPLVFQDYHFDGTPGIASAALFDRGYLLGEEEHDPVTALVNFSFNKMTLGTEEGMLTLKCSDSFYADYPAGMYPVLSRAEAYDKLMSGDYVTTVWTDNYLPDGISENDVTFNGIAYKRTEDRKYWLPYYKYLIELHPEQPSFPDGIKEYRAFYVPAVRPEYLNDVDTEVAFN